MDYVTLFLRTSLMYLIALLVFRLMGKRSVANMAPFDLAVMIMIGDVAGIGIQNPNQNVWHVIIPIFTLGLLQIFLSWINLYSRPLECITQGVSTLLVRNGQVIRANLYKERMSMADLIIFLREQGVENIAQVEEARLEPNGKVSVRLRPEERSLTPRDLVQTPSLNLAPAIRWQSARLREDLARLQDLLRSRRPLP